MRFTIGLMLVVAASPASAQTWCHPLDVTARILASHNPNDVHPDWTGENRIGTAWAFSPGERVKTDDAAYIKGDLYSPRGGLINKNVYIIEREWDCPPW